VPETLYEAQIKRSYSLLLMLSLICSSTKLPNISNISESIGSAFDSIRQVKNQLEIELYSSFFLIYFWRAVR